MNNFLKEIWVYAEQHYGKIDKVVYELLNKSRKLANKLNMPLVTILLGHKIRKKAKQLIIRGADKVYVLDDVICNDFKDDVYANILLKLIKSKKPELLLFGSTLIGKSIAPRIAANIEAGIISNCVAFKLNYSSKTNFEKISFITTNKYEGKKEITTVTISKNKLKIVVVKPDTLIDRVLQNRTGNIIDIKLKDNEIVSKIKSLNIKIKQQTEMSSNIIVSGGRGLGNEKGFILIKQLAKAIGGTIGASKPPVDLKWISNNFLIGKHNIVSPKVYIACGISGQMKHMEGVNINNDTIIIAINKDPHCKIMEIATYAIVGDLYKIIPEIIKEIMFRRTNKINNVYKK
ncbi:MAG: electron transfer flavoprotein subunit alpha/FixB family protein [Endomicrobium sp.]|jgi:electron transfer flavoprotein alpha subunit|nr:electron transfer flavoprotein subunit alpha/FixB family protein [Endomicrobium sp.]